jgi:predicted DNA-binding transcriptional regulator YafY
MDKNIPFSKRIVIIDKILNSELGVTYEDIIHTITDKYEFDETETRETISLRTIQNDINYLKNQKAAPIVIEFGGPRKRTAFLKYSRPFSIYNININEAELSTLKNLLLELSRFSGRPNLDGLDNIIEKLNLKLELPSSDALAIQYQDSEGFIGREHIPVLYDCIINKKPIKIEYKSFVYPKETINFHPYFLKQFNSRWYVYGLRDDKKHERHLKIENLGLDRIIKIESSSKKFINSYDSFIDYFDQFYGVSNPDDRHTEKIILHFYGLTGRYIESNPIHHTQSRKSNWINENILEVVLNLKLNIEIENKILSFGENVKVIEPEELRDKIKARMKKALELYKM